jgi:hypothetical protein
VCSSYKNIALLSKNTDSETIPSIFKQSTKFVVIFPHIFFNSTHVNYKYRSGIDIYNYPLLKKCYSSKTRGLEPTSAKNAAAAAVEFSPSVSGAKAQKGAGECARQLA